MAKVLIVYAHPRNDRSEVNSALVAMARKLNGVSLVDLYEEYPSFDIDVDREQARLSEPDILIFQHPVYWYSSPALLKEWTDLVFEHGFAYGSGGEALKGKILMNAVTAGARRDAYRDGGAYSHELKQLFLPFKQTAHLCGMRYLAPFAVFGAGHAIEENLLEGHVSDYKILLEALVEERVDLTNAERENILNEHLVELVSNKSEVL